MFATAVLCSSGAVLCSVAADDDNGTFRLCLLREACSVALPVLLELAICASLGSTKCNQGCMLAEMATDGNAGLGQCSVAEGSNQSSRMQVAGENACSVAKHNNNTSAMQVPQSIVCSVADHP